MVCLPHFFLMSNYEWLFARRCVLENEGDLDTPEPRPPLRKRFRGNAVLFPTEPLLPRYQY
jgi:hypothetical protein